MKSCKKILFRNDIVAPVFLGCQLVGGTVQSGSEKSRGCSSQGRELSSDTPAVLLLLMWIIFLLTIIIKHFVSHIFFINELDASTFLSWEMRILFGIIYFRTFTFLSGERWSQYIGRLLAIPESVPLMSREKDLEEGGGVATQEQSQIWFWKIILWQWRDRVLQKIAKMEFLFFTSSGVSRVPISNTLFGRF